jgi:hypothetical protein
MHFRAGYAVQEAGNDMKVWTARDFLSTVWFVFVKKAKPLPAAPNE